MFLKTSVKSIKRYKKANQSAAQNHYRFDCSNNLGVPPLVHNTNLMKDLRDVGYHTKKSIFLDFWETHKINFSAFLEFLITEYRLPVGYH